MKLVNVKITKQLGLATKNELAAVENKIPDANILLKKTDLNAQITEAENKIPSINGLAANSALTAVKNKIPDVSSLVKKTDLMKQELMKQDLQNGMKHVNANVD